MTRRSKGAAAVVVLLIAAALIIVLVRQRTSTSARQEQAPVQPQRAASPAEAVLPAGAPTSMDSSEPESLSEEEQEAIDQDIVHRAQITPASQLESALPAQPFEAWLQQAVGSSGNVEWEANDCGEFDGSGQQTSIPVCGEAMVKFRDGRQFSAFVVVGSQAIRAGATPEWLDKPSVWWTWISFGDSKDGCPINLAALPQWLAVPANQISAKCKGKTP